MLYLLVALLLLLTGCSSHPDPDPNSLETSTSSREVPEGPKPIQVKEITGSVYSTDAKHPTLAFLSEPDKDKENPKQLWVRRENEWMRISLGTEILMQPVMNPQGVMLFEDRDNYYLWNEKIVAVPHPEGAQPPEDDRYAARKEGRASKVNESRRAIALPDGAFLVFSGSRIIRIRDNKADIITSDYREFSHYSTLTVCGADESGSPIVWHSKRYTGNSDTKLSGVIESGKIIEPRGNYALEDLDSAAKPQCINDRLVTLGVVRHGKNNGTSDPAEVKIWGGLTLKRAKNTKLPFRALAPGPSQKGN